MKNVMWKGQLGGIVSLDTLAPKKGLYGLGPLAYLKGELLILDGNVYASTVNSQGQPQVALAPKSTAPFFVYGNATQWQQKILPQAVNDLASLEEYVAQQTIKKSEPFIFKIEGTVNTAKYHIQNLADNSVVTNPQEAHAGQQSFALKNRKVIIVGFYSKNHKGVFTHHDTNMHLHIITADKSEMGHLDGLELDPNAVQKLFLADHK